MTAEWKCSKCGATNRKLVPEGKTEIQDRCVTCGTRYTVREEERPVFWQATAKS